MVNVYMFRSDLTTPSGWTDNSANYEGKYPIIGITPLSTGGSNTHTHTVTSPGTSGANPNTTVLTQNTASSNCTNGDHTHTVSAINLNTPNHEPLYTTLRLVSRSIIGWSVVPSGNICFTNTLNGGTYTEYLNGTYSKYIKISATPGSSGGSNTHTHTTSGTTDGPSNGISCSTGGSYNPSSTHTHTWNGSVSTYTYTGYWSCWKNNMEYANIDTTPIGGQFYLFDGDPGIGWTQIGIDNGSDGRYLYKANSYAISGTSITEAHTHTCSITSSNASATASNQNTYSGRTPIVDHTHQITGTVVSANMTLAYVGFAMYKYLGTAMSFSIIMTC